MPSGLGQIETVRAPASPFPASEMQHVAGSSTARASHSQPDAVQATSPSRHRPRAQLDVNRHAACLDHEARGGPGNPRERSASWVLPPQIDGFTEAGERSQGQAGGIADEAAIWERNSACSDGSDHSGEILLALLHREHDLHDAFELNFDVPGERHLFPQDCPQLGVERGGVEGPFVVALVGLVAIPVRQFLGCAGGTGPFASSARILATNLS